MIDPLLGDLHPLQLVDLPRFKQAIADGQQQGWNFYFPYLLFVRLGSQSTRYLWQEINGSLCLFRHRYGRKRRLDLAFPPVPYQETALQRALERITDFNQGRNARIYFIDEQDMPHLRALNDWRLSKRNPQYLYSPQDLEQLAGSQFRHLRRNIGTAKRQAEIAIQAYGPEHARPCRQLLDAWETRKENTSEGLYLQRRYALNAFHFAPQMHDRDLQGFVYRVDGQVRAFTFGGEIRPSLGCLMLAIADPDINCLSYLIRQHFFANMRECDIVNDGSDGGQNGLREMKQRFRPYGFHTPYTAKQVTRRSARITRPRREQSVEHSIPAAITNAKTIHDAANAYPRARYELRPSRLLPDQVGLFALVAFPAKTIIIPHQHFDETRLITWEALETLDQATRFKLVQYCFKNKKGLYAPKDINRIGICYFINHSCDPNLSCNEKGDFIARRDVQAGEELTADLEKNMKKTYSEFICACQSPNCRKIIRI
ncbi:MAG: phosphatidylglycerol lysyltransferase domain-containing protein [Lamprobacter sp.]|uniref:phosphatidylglycerol lysyltransferase domain-containing protein n=1 Tax=Lamprobacter sp. TaxID=3100796 RepID=UPI002B261297|nr:phosphatidylglycerol lysyltransferase domain-containing protein [Lamprobacter sp.]MEA3640882.1 phosphatidylglycerol lysyltransferase domain-containing protein [Lamprobacter sp.]